MTQPEVPWFKPRNYIHFDWPIGINSIDSTIKYVSDPKKVSEHSFYPLINYTIKSKKIRKDKSEKLVPKIKSRPISYAAHLDSQIYSYYSSYLSTKYEEKLDKTVASDSVLAFRKLGKSNIDFASDAFAEIVSLAPCTVIAIDITGFFDNLNHKILKQAWSSLIDKPSLPSDHFNIYKSLTKHCCVDRSELYKTLGISKHNPKNSGQRICTPKQFRENVRGNNLLKINEDQKGIPQGSPISALLSNIYMFDFDIKISEIITEVGGKYYRYCDDMLFIVKNEYASGVEIKVREILDELKLEAHPDKTETVRFRTKGKFIYSEPKPLQYLGFTFDGVRILIRSASIAKFTERMKRGVALAKATKRKRDKYREANNIDKRPLFKSKIYERYSHLGKRNFIRYGLRASKSLKSRHIRKQLNSLWLKLEKEINK